MRTVFIAWGVGAALLLGAANFLGWGLPWDDDDAYETSADVRSNPRSYQMQSHAK